jgi:hypothetical protein
MGLFKNMLNRDTNMHKYKKIPILLEVYLIKKIVKVVRSEKYKF